jgi:hypothetical protein
MSRSPLAEHTSPASDNRVTLPKHLCDRFTWITGKEVQAWLFLPEPGRYRLLSDEDVENDPQLESVRLLILQEKSAVPTQPSYVKNMRDAAVVARLIPITIDLHKGSWRVLFAEEWAALAPPDSNPRALSILISPEGYLEIWYSDVLRRALAPPWHNQR